jgi:hypothetical protein
MIFAKPIVTPFLPAGTDQRSLCVVCVCVYLGVCVSLWVDPGSQGGCRLLAIYKWSFALDEVRMDFGVGGRGVVAWDGLHRLEYPPYGEGVDRAYFGVGVHGLELIDDLVAPVADQVGVHGAVAELSVERVERRGVHGAGPVARAKL